MLYAAVTMFSIWGITAAPIVLIFHLWGWEAPASDEGEDA